MISIVLAITVGVLFATGTYMILRRGQIKLILGLGLLSHGVNLLLFGSGKLVRGVPPIFLDKEHYLEELLNPNIAKPDPLPQALILTAIVISFGITAFVIVLVNRRHTITNTDVVQGELTSLLRENDPFEQPADRVSTANMAVKDSGYDWLAYELDEVYDQEGILPSWPPASTDSEENSEEEDF